ncbi:MAG: hydroxymethylglutaryl-CoA lyase [Acidobacteriota bacterium]|nr:hydroxymethylglutaryl-CoA lyase [Acidobacteriota bacterium]
MNLPKQVTIMDVSPRDGLQSEVAFVPTEKKIALIEALVGAGIRHIEATSFVSPKWVPQMADAEALLQAVVARHPGVAFEVLLPNEKGYDRARATGLLKEAGFVVAATENLNVKNVNMSVADSMKQVAAIAEKAKADGVHLRGTIGVSFVCPYEGEVPRARTVALANQYFELGADEVCIADTIGRALPNRVYDVMADIKDRWPSKPLAGHFHDTYKMALTNIFAAMQAGVEMFDSAVGNLGGCQFAKGATGNVSTEQLVYLLNGIGIETGIDYERIVAAGRMARVVIAPLLSTDVRA